MTNVEKEPSILKRSMTASNRCLTALQSIFASIGQIIIGKRKPYWLIKISASFLTILGWLFFSVAFTPAFASGICEKGAEKLIQISEEEPKGESCSEESSLQ